MTLPAIGFDHTSLSTTGASSVPARRSSSVRPDELRPLRVELVQTGLPGARHRLVRRHDHAVDARGAVQRRERGDRDHRRAVRARRDALREVREVLGVHLGDDERARRGPCGTRPSCRPPSRRRRPPAAPTPRERSSSTSMTTRSRPSKQPGAQHFAARPRRRGTAACGPPTGATRRPAARRPGSRAPRGCAASRCRPCRSRP